MCADTQNTDVGQYLPVDSMEGRRADERCLGQHMRLPDSEGACWRCKAVVTVEMILKRLRGKS